MPTTASGLSVVETVYGHAYLGEVEEDDGGLYVYTGYVGRPPFIPLEHVEAVIPAEDHPDVEGL